MRAGGVRPRIVFDCNVLVQAVAFDDSPAAQALGFLESGDIELFVSARTLAELRAVLRYPKVRSISPNLTSLRIDAFFDRLSFRATLQRNVRSRFKFPRDPKDEPYLDLCSDAKAHYLVTWDQDLLWLMTGHTLICKQFRQATSPLKVLDPPAFLQEMRKQGRTPR